MKKLKAILNIKVLFKFKVISTKTTIFQSKNQYYNQKIKRVQIKRLIKIYIKTAMTPYRSLNKKRFFNRVKV